MRLGKAHPRASDSERGRHVSRGSHLDFGEHRPRPVPRPERRLRNDPDLLEEPTNAPQDETDPARRGQAFQENMKKHGLARAVIHANYLINLASPKKNGLRYSRAAFVEELDRAQVLGIRDVIFHPGAHLGKGEAYALKTVAASLDWSLDHSEAPDVFAVLEITAGQ